MLEYHPQNLQPAVKDLATMVAVLKSIYDTKDDMYIKLDLTYNFVDHRNTLTEYFSGQTNIKTFENLCAAIGGIKEFQTLKNLCSNVTDAMKIVEQNSDLYRTNIQEASAVVETTCSR